MRLLGRFHHYGAAEADEDATPDPGIGLRGNEECFAVGLLWSLLSVLAHAGHHPIYANSESPLLCFLPLTRLWGF